jgi:hypothetical protein
MNNITGEKNSRVPFIEMYWRELCRVVTSWHSHSHIVILSDVKLNLNHTANPNA